MNSHASFSQQSLLARRSIGQHAWNLAGFPLRFAMLPDHWNGRLGFSSLEEERLRAVLPCVEGELLDVGAGGNTLVRTYEGPGVGVDVFDFGGGAKIVSDTRDLPFDASSFDTVTFIACLNHIPYRLDALREAFRVLRPGGRLVATMINRFLGDIGHAIWWYGEDRHRGGMLEGETGGLNVSEMRRLLADAGFGDIQLRRFSYGLNGLYLARRPVAAAVRAAA